MFATMADAHREWHLNTGVPIGTPGCPQDACHPPEPSCWECFDTDPECPQCRPCTSFRAEHLHEPCDGLVGPTPLGFMCQKHADRLQQVVSNITEHELRED